MVSFIIYNKSVEIFYLSSVIQVQYLVFLFFIL